MPTRPEDIVNEALTEISPDEIGDLYDGSAASVRALRIYDSVLRELHAGAPWNFTRRQRQLDVIGDTSGTYSSTTGVPSPWSYMYEWPIDCVHARYVLGAGAMALDASGAPVGPLPSWNRPAPFIVGDAAIPNDVNSSWDTSEGHSPESTRVILTNELGAILVYTGLVQYPDAWDPLFRRAFVACLAARMAVPAVISDPRVRAQTRQEQLVIAREALVEARVRDGNEGWTIVDHTPDWIRARTGPATYGVYCSLWSPMPMLEDAGGVY